MNSLEQHLAIEYNDFYTIQFIREGKEYKSILSEERGYVPNLFSYVRAFNKALPEKFTSGRWFVVDDNVFDNIPNRFFKHIRLKIRVSLGDKEYYRGAYKTGTGWVDVGSKIMYHPEIELDVVGPSAKDIIVRLESMIAHELTHVYEDYQRQLKGKTSLYDLYNIKHYDKLQWTIDSKFSERMLKKFLYAMNPQEQNAMVGGLKAELSRKVKDLTSSRKAEEFLEGTETYKSYKFLENLALRFKTGDFKDITKQKMVEWIKIINPKTEIKSFKELAEYCWRIWIAYDRRFKNRVSKMIYDSFQETFNEHLEIHPNYDDETKYWANISKSDLEND